MSGEPSQYTHFSLKKKRKKKESVPKLKGKTMRNNSENVPKNFLQWECGLGISFMQWIEFRVRVDSLQNKMEFPYNFLLTLEMFQF